MRRWAAGRVLEGARDQLRIELDVSDRAITIQECRPPWEPERAGPDWTRLPIARFRYTKARQEWSLYWCDRHLRFHAYDRVEPTPRVEELLAEIDRDPAGIFWG